MVVAEQTRLAAVLDDWLRRQRVPVAHLTRVGKVSANTIWLIQQGTTTKPEIQTLRKIARGLATDPADAAFDQIVYAEALRDLAGAADLAGEIDDIPTPTLEAAIRAEGVKSPRKAARLAAFVRKYPNMTANQLRLVDALIDNLGGD